MVDVETTRHPIPRLHNRYPWRTMKVGESFFVEADSQSDKKRVQDNLCSDMHRKGQGLVFRTKRVENGVRVWRVR